MLISGVKYNSMSKRKSRARSSRKKIAKRRFPLELFICLILIAVGVFFINYKPKPVLPLDENIMVTTLPPEFSRVLGEKSSNFGISLRVPILMYHYIEYVQDKGDTIRQSLDITPFTFEEQIKTLKSAGYSFVTTSDIVQALNGQKSLPPKAIVLTFDDGYRDFYTDAFPIIKKYKIRVVAYIVPNFIDRPNYMFSDQLVEIKDSGLVEIAAHTMDHVWLKGISKEVAKEEIADSKKVLEEKLHITVNSFAYPYGAFDRQAMDLVKSAGFTNAASTVPGVAEDFDNIYFLYRLRPGARTGDTLLNFLLQTTFSPY